MKKSIFLMAGLVGLALTSCEDKSDLGVMQKNDAPVVVPADGVAIQSKFGLSQQNQLNLNYYVNGAIEVIDIELNKKFGNDVVVSGVAEIASKDDFSDAIQVDMTSVEAATNGEAAEKAGGDTNSYIGVIDGNLWEDAFVSLYNLDPAPKVNYVRYKLYLAEGNQKNILYYNGEEWWPAYEILVTPVDAALDVDPAYKFVYYIGGNQYSVDMYHDPDKHVYDDPNFNVSIEVSEENALAGFYWTIVSATNSTKVYGVSVLEDDDATSGHLAPYTASEEEARRGTIPEANSYKIEANMLLKEFKVLIAPKSLYVISLSGMTFDQAGQLATDDYVSYAGMAGILSKWGLTGQSGYKPTLYINNDAVEVTTSGITNKGGLLYSSSGSPLTSTTAIPIPGKGAGLYYLTANLQTMVYTGYRCSDIGIVGTMNNWGNADDSGKVTADIALKGSRTTFYMVWTGTVEIEEGQEWKIRANSDWVVNFGAANGSGYATDGTPVELSMGGDNFVAAESGKYNITVNFKRVIGEDGKMTPCYMTLTPAN